MVLIQMLLPTKAADGSDATALFAETRRELVVRSLAVEMLDTSAV